MTRTTLFGSAGLWQEFAPAPSLDGTPPATAETKATPGARISIDLSATHLCRTGALSVGVHGDPRWTGDPSLVANADNPAEVVLRTYRQFGARCLEQMHGGFAIALIEHDTGLAMLAVDRMGIERLAYASGPSGIVFGSSAKQVANFPGIRGTLRPQALFDYLLLHMVPAPLSAYESVHKLEPASVVTFHDGRVAIRRYWTPAFVESGRADYDDLRTGLRTSLSSAVAACATEGAVGSFLSGGLDSSTVSGLLAQVTGRAAPTFSIGFDIAEYNEIEYARIASRHFHTTPHEYFVTAADVVDAFPKIASAYDEPFGNSSAVPTYFCAQLAARNGIDTLLAGDGGDELFGGNERYARHAVFSAYQRVPAWVRTRVVEPFTRAIDPESRITPLRKIRSYVDQALIPLPDRLESWNLMYRTDLDEMLDPEFHAAVDPQAPLRAMAAVYNAAPASSQLNKMLYLDWHYTLADSDIRKVTTMCGLAGVRVLYPMLNQAVVEASLRIPPNLKMRRLELRHFYKRAMRDFLPAEIIAKRKHGFGLPFGVWLKTNQQLADLIYSLLSDLKSRRIVNRQFLTDLVDEHRAGHPTYFGHAIWDLAMLEAWMKAHVRSGASH